MEAVSIIVGIVSFIEWIIAFILFCALKESALVRIFFFVAMIIPWMTFFFINNHELYELKIYLPLVISPILCFIGCKIFNRLPATPEDINYMRDRFYQKCVDAGVHKCTTPYEIEKAKKIGESMGYHFADVKKELAAIEARHKADADLEEKKKQDEIRQQDKARSSYECSFTIYNAGYQKRIKMLNDAIIQNKQGKKDHEKKADMIKIGAGYEKEHSWATHGGLASGLAGPAAGISVALDTMAENEQIRGRNAAKKALYGPAEWNERDMAIDCQTRIKKYKKMIDEAPLKLISKETSAECFDKLEFSNIDCKLSQAGTYTVSATVSLKTPIKFIKDGDGVIDGTIRANIYDGAHKVGFAVLVIPAEGINNYGYITGTFVGSPSPSDAQFNTKYTLKFEPIHLWAMEK
ncbi:MAG: hypothetical protein IKM67_00380 [Clostridia bacterium]|nr:hypothetical protein [Clostridia bacterium]